MNRLRRIVFLSACFLFAVWIVVNFSTINSDDDGLIRFVLGIVLGSIVLFRWKPPQEKAPPLGWAIPVAGLVAMLAAVIGIVFRVHQLQWLGLILILYACLRWSLPARFSRDIVLALFLIYWVHPLPAQVLGKLVIGMQAVSVSGAEWLLHILGVRVWADGLILRAGFQDFGVPESCSGLRTSVTVLLCTTGVGILFRFRWYETVAFLALGVIQVMLLNMVRIAGMVWWAPRMPREWAESFLHDTLGIFLLATIFLVQMEASAWKVARERRRRVRTAQASGEADRPDRATLLPSFWRVIFRGWIAAAGVVALAVLVAVAVYARRPGHRSAMIAGVIDGLMETNPEAAERALAEATRYTPDNPEFVTLRIRVLVRRGKFEQALQEMDALGRPLTTIEAIMKSWALMALNRPKEAIAVVNALPPADQNLPGVAIVKAEFAATEDHPDVVASNVVIAAKHHALVRRVRGLYSYLASREQWQAIASSDYPVRYPEIAQALIAINANLKVNNIAGTARVMDLALQSWPNDPRFLGSLFTLAVNRPGGVWEERAEAALLANLATLDADRTANIIDDCFQIYRPDLAWLAYLRLQALDPQDPTLALVVARFAPGWFTFRKQRVGVKSDDKLATIDLRPLFLTTRHQGPLDMVWRQVPLADAFARQEPKDIGAQALIRCLDEFQKREAAGKLTRRLELMYPTALGLAGKFVEAEARLAKIAGQYPDIMAQVHLQQGVMYAQQEQWQEAYEAIIDDYLKEERPSLNTHLLLINILMHLDLSICAMDVAERASRLFPGAPQLSTAIAGIWDTFGFKEQALYTLERAGHEEPLSYVQLIYETGRIREAERISRSGGVTLVRKATDRQVWQLPEAELAVAKRWPPPLSRAEMAQEARDLTRDAQPNASPFIDRLRRLIVAWDQTGGEGTSDLAAWRACGRNAYEQAAALHRLAVLLGRQQRYKEAEQAAREAVQLMPDAAILRRLLIGLSDGDPDVVDAAAKKCPTDPDVWLATLVVKHRQQPGGTWAVEEMNRAIAGETFSLGTVIRAGEFMLKVHQNEAATLAAHYALDHARSLLPAYVLAIRAALAAKNLDWALDVALKGIDAAEDPAPFYKTIVDIKTVRRSTDTDMVSALEFLSRQYPKDPEWVERLGMVYFQKGDSRRSLNILKAAVAQETKGASVQSLVLAAEAARVEGDLRTAVQLLEQAYKLHPDNMVVLNNLVYCLSQSGETMPRALQLLPLLLEMKDTNIFPVMDTAAMVYLHAGELEKAKRFMQQALELLNENDYAALEASLNSARVFYDLGDYRQAAEILTRIRKNPARSALVENGARDLMRKVREKMGGAVGAEERE